MSAINNPYALRVEAQHLGLFETPITYSTLHDAEPMLADLAAAIAAKRSGHTGVSRSNIGSWHSDTDMLDWGGAAAIKLAETAISIAKRMSHFLEGSAESYNWYVRMWANVTPRGGLNHIHAHPGNLWAAVLYLDMGDDDSDAGGALYLEDPRFPMAAMHDTSLRMLGVNGLPQKYEVDLKLQRGNLVVFPAWLRHGVRQYNGHRERVSIAMNIDARRK